MSKKCWLLPGRTYSFQYPRHNYDGIPSKRELRRGRVKYIRDLKADPLDVETRESNPLLSRGRWLVVCEDLDKGLERSFYFESMEQLNEVTTAIEPLDGMKFCVVDQRRVTFSTTELGEAYAFAIGRRSGIICSLMSSGAS